MQPQVEVKPEEKTVQVQNQPVEKVVKEEASPDIKSEENKTNWAAVREQRAADRKAKEEANKRAEEKVKEVDALKAALEAIVNKPNTNRQFNEPYQEYGEESEDDKMQRKIDAAVSQRLEQERRKDKEEQQVRDRQELPKKLQQAYPDFDRVVSDENKDYLEYHYPEVVAAFNHAPDSFETWSNVYKAIKRFVPNTDTRKDQAKMDKNLQKPGSISSTGTSQGGNTMSAARLDEQRKADNWARMQKTLKGLSS